MSASKLIEDITNTQIAFAVKVDGKVDINQGLGRTKIALQNFTLFRHGYMSCDRPECSCRDKALAKHMPNVQIVPVKVIELEG